MKEGELPAALQTGALVGLVAFYCLPHLSRGFSNPALGLWVYATLVIAGLAGSFPLSNHGKPWRALLGFIAVLILAGWILLAPSVRIYYY